MGNQKMKQIEAETTQRIHSKSDLPPLPPINKEISSSSVYIIKLKPAGDNPYNGSDVSPKSISCSDASFSSLATPIPPPHCAISPLFMVNNNETNKATENVVGYNCSK